ncbi:hypothetical protein [Streptomyces sp. NPDC101150]
MAALVATVWSTWTQRSRKAGDGEELAGYARFREAMEREHSASDPASDPA